jgi:cell wall-associated NlpC family hydrolase
MANAGVSGLAVAEIAAGLVLAWSGIENVPIQTVIKSFVSGKLPTPGPAVSYATPASATSSDAIGAIGGGSAAGSTTDSAIANDALQYQGHCYSYGGAPGTSGQGCWDCSSFVNWVLGHDLHIDIPGVQNYNGSSHGPTTLSYLVWGGGTRISSSEIQAGDLCVWQTHMGIAISNSEMISALNESLGTMVTTISGGAPAGELLIPMRVKAA